MFFFCRAFGCGEAKAPIGTLRCMSKTVFWAVFDIFRLTILEARVAQTKFPGFHAWSYTMYNDPELRKGGSPGRGIESNQGKTLKKKEEKIQGYVL